MKVDTQRRRLLGLGASAALAGLSGCSGLTPVVGKRIENTRTFAADTVSTVAVAGRNGDVTVRPADGDEIRVETVKKSGSVFVDLDDVQVETVTEGGELRIETRRTGDGSWLGGHPSVDVTVGLPSGVGLGELSSENGSIDVRNVDSDATLTTENGRLEARNLGGFVSAETENGRVVARDVAGIDGVRTENGRVDVDVTAIRGDTAVETENGRVTAAVSPDLDAEVVATVERGDLDVDLPSLEASTRSERQVTGTLGDGGPELRFRTENGSVSVSELR